MRMRDYSFLFFDKKKHLRAGRANDPCSTRTSPNAYYSNYSDFNEFPERALRENLCEKNALFIHPALQSRPAG